MAMLNILMLGPGLLARGGIATVERYILEAVRERGDRAEFISTYVEGGKARKLAVAIRAYCSYLGCVSRYDAVHVHMASRGSFARKKIFINTAFRRGIPVILHLHGSEFDIWFRFECSERKREEIRSIFKKCAKVIVLSEEWCDFLLEQKICGAEKISILHNAVCIPAENQTDYARNQVLFLGRLGERKSPDTLLLAAPVVLQRFPQARFVFGGDGDISKYEAIADMLGVLPSCRFVGWVTGDEKRKLFDESDIYCLPSKNEGMPMSVLEAMAHGLAAIATPVGGVPQVIDDGVNGLLVSVGDAGQLAETLSFLMGNPDEKKRIGQEGRSRIEERFGMDSYIRRMMEIYEEVAR